MVLALPPRTNVCKSLVINKRITGFGSLLLFSKCYTHIYRTNQQHRPNHQHPLWIRKLHSTSFLKRIRTGKTVLIYRTRTNNRFNHLLPLFLNSDMSNRLHPIQPAAIEHDMLYIDHLIAGSLIQIFQQHTITMNTMHLLSCLPVLHTTPPGTTTGQQNNQQTNRNKQTSTPHIHTYPPFIY